MSREPVSGVVTTGPLALMIIAMLVALVLSIVARCHASTPARCHGLEPTCGLQQSAICLCPSRSCADSKCAWVCGAVSP